MNQIPSPNFNDRAKGCILRYIILHYTGRPTANEALKMLLDPAREVSAHYIIDKDGFTLQLVPEDKRAWHAGVSYWQGETDLNSLSIGIELVNPGHEFGYKPFPAEQIAALKALLRDILDRHNLPANSIWGHSDIAPLRKQDPGELFPWEELAKDGLGIWPDFKQPFENTDRAIEDYLAEIGYDCRTDEAAKASVIAFLRHFHPERVDLGPDEDSLHRAAALFERLKSD